MLVIVVEVINYQFTPVIMDLMVITDAYKLAWCCSLQLQNVNICDRLTVNITKGVSKHSVKLDSSRLNYFVQYTVVHIIVHSYTALIGRSYIIFLSVTMHEIIFVNFPKSGKASKCKHNKMQYFILLVATPHRFTAGKFDGKYLWGGKNYNQC